MVLNYFKGYRLCCLKDETLLLGSEEVEFQKMFSCSLKCLSGFFFINKCCGTQGKQSSWLQVARQLSRHTRIYI